MPVKTKTPTRRSKREMRRKGHTSRSRDLRTVGTSRFSKNDSPTVSALKRSAAITHSSSLQKTAIHTVQVQNSHAVSLSNPFTPKAHVEIATDAWYDLLVQDPDLCYLNISGQFNRKNGYFLHTTNGAVSIADAFRVLSPDDPYQGAYVISNGNKIAYNGLYTNAKTQAVIKAAIETGRRVAASLPIEHYHGLISNTGASALKYDFPYGSSFSKAVMHILSKNSISSSEFMERTNLDYNIYSKLKNQPTYIPERSTCMAILFAVQPTIKIATDLFELATHHFTDAPGDRLLLAMFANQDYDINDYNRVMEKNGLPTLGSKSRRAPNSGKRLFPRK